MADRKDDVTALHPDYEKALPTWTLVNDACAGERAVKEKEDLYLPRPNELDKSEENKTRYKQYLKRAVYYNASGRTALSMSGLAFRRWPEIELPGSLEAIQDNVSGSGVPLIQQAQSTLMQVVKTGRCGLLVDYPRTEGPQSRADQQAGGMLPTISLYTETAITNWRTTKVGSRVKLSMVVLKETEEIENGFEIRIETQYRVLKLENGIYVQEIWRRKRNDNGGIRRNAKFELDETITPLQGNGRPWNEIPFTFIGSRSNDTSINPAPLEDIASLNIAHYRNSADYEESVYMVGQGQVWMSGIDETWVKMLKDEGFYFGARTPLPLPVNGQAGLLQMEENTLCKGAMDQKEAQMAALGARLVQAGSANAPITATQTESNDAVAHSVLSLCCDNVSMGFTQALMWAANFANAEGEVVFSISTEFTKIIDAQTADVLIKAVQSGLMPESDLWAALRAAGYIDSKKSDDMIREEIRQQIAAGGRTELDDIDETDPERDPAEVE